MKVIEFGRFGVVNKHDEIFVIQLTSEQEAYITLLFEAARDFPFVQIREYLGIEEGTKLCVNGFSLKSDDTPEFKQVKWWLISDEDVKEMTEELSYAISTGRSQGNAMKNVLHRFETGLHSTDAIPDDYLYSTNGLHQKGWSIKEVKDGSIELLELQIRALYDALVSNKNRDRELASAVINMGDLFRVKLSE